MYKPALLVALLGCAFAQPPMPFLPPGCDFESLRECVEPIAQSGLMMRDPRMALTSPVTPDLNTVCGLMDGLKRCAMPKLESCGKEIMSVANAVFRAVDYMCVEARSETEKYMACFQNQGNAQAFMPCINQMIEAQQSLQASIMENPRDINVQKIMGSFCGILNNYETCAERTAGSVCGEEAYVTKLFNIINSGLSFMNCTEFRAGHNRPVLGERKEWRHEGRHEWRGKMSEQSPFMQEMQCVMSDVQTCVKPMASQLRPWDWNNVDKICRAFSGVGQCENGGLKEPCEDKLASVYNFLQRVYRYLCVEHKQEFQSSLGCMSREMPMIVRKCVGPMMSMESRGDMMSAVQSGNIPDKMKDMMCKMESHYQSCFYRHLERRCGETSIELLSDVRDMSMEMAETVFGISCPREIPTDQGWGRWYQEEQRRKRRKILLIVLPIAGVILLAIIAAVAIAIKRRHGRKCQQEKGELVKDDLLQQNLHFSSGPTTPEKSVDGGMKI